MAQSVSRIEFRQVVLLAAVVGLLAAVARLWLAPALTPSGRAQVNTALLIVSLIPLSYLLLWLRQSGHRLAARQSELRRELAGERQELEQTRRQLQMVHAAFRPEQLHDERNQLVRLLSGPRTTAPERVEWLRLLALEGPGSDVWLGLGRALTAAGQGREAVRCAVEAVRAGLRPPEFAFELAERLLEAEADREKLLGLDHPAALLALAGSVDVRDTAAVGRLYDAIARSREAVTVRALAAVALVRRAGDAEEAARLQERLKPAGDDDLLLRFWLTEAWSAFRRGPDGRRALPWRETSPAAVAAELTPVHWRPAFGLETPPGYGHTVRYLDPLPTYAVPERDRLEALAREMQSQVSAVPESMFSSETTPETLADYIVQRLWPRSQRSRRFVEELVGRLATHDSPRHIAVALEPIGAALSEESAAALKDLCHELEAVAHRLPPSGYAARALHAAGYAWSPRDGARAEALWEESLRVARRLDPISARPILARFVPTFIALAQSAATAADSAQPMLLAVDVAIDSGSREALLGALQATCAMPPSRVRSAALDRLANAVGWMDCRARFLLAWSRRDVAGMAALLPELWSREPDAPVADWPAVARGTQLLPGRLGAPPHPWLWAVWALAERAGAGQAGDLSQAMAPFAERGRQGEPASLAAWLILASRLDVLEQRPARSEARRALEQIASLPGSALAAPLLAVRWTLLEPTTRWLDAVEIVLLKRIRLESRRLDRYQDPGLLRAVVADLGPAHVRALMSGWLERYRTDVAEWLRRQWAG